MFQSLRTIHSAFALTRIYLLLMTLLALGLGGYALYASYRFAEAQRQKIYVLDGGTSLVLALAQDVNQNRAAEARSHLSRFHEYFFTISPDKEAIEHNVGRALYLAGNEAMEQYQRLKEEGFYDRVMAAGIHCEIQTDSVCVDESTYPLRARYYGKTSIVRSSNITFRNLITECELVNCARSDHNPHGFTIEKWKIIDNSDIKTIER